MEKIVLLNDSFVSEVLLTTLEKEQISAFAEGSLRKKLVERKIPVLGLKEAKQKISSNKCLIYSNAENFLPLVSQNHKSKGFVKSIKLFKNKFLFRNLTSSFCPGFFFRQIKLRDADLFKPQKGKEFILKPSIGFLSLGIKKFSCRESFENAVSEALKEIQAYRKAFDSSILDESNFLIEEIIEGEEFACDAYFDKKGKPVILGIYCHPFRDKEDVRDVVYFTGKSVIEKNLEKVNDFLRNVFQKTKLQNFPVHFEFRITPQDTLIPIEINPLRFGGFGLADLTFHCFGINSYEFFLNQKKPDWKEILANSRNNFHAFVLGRMENIQIPNIEKFKQTFRKLNAFVELDYKTFPVFCTAYSESPDLNELLKYLYFDFGEYEL